MFKQKAITSIIAVSILFLIMVLFYIILQNWFFSTNSTLNVLVESEVGKLDIEIDSLNNDNLYVLNNNNKTLTNLKIGGVNCTSYSILSTNSSVDVFNVSTCVSGLTTDFPEIIINRNDLVVSRKVYHLK